MAVTGLRFSPRLQRERSLRNLENMAWLLDRSIRLPGGLRIGLDGVLGLVPVVGDALGMGLSLIIVLQARQLGASGRVQFAMLRNILLDTVLGSLPFVGDLFDFWFNANARNMVLLNEYMGYDTPARLATDKEGE